MHEVVKPMPRRKSSLWKVAFWLLVGIILGQLIWLISIPLLRRVIEVEKKHTLPLKKEQQTNGVN